MQWKDLGTQLAKLGLPLLGAALPVPGGAAIGAALAAALGSDATPASMLDAITHNAQAAQVAREFEATHQAAMLKLTVDAELRQQELTVDDRKDARAMQVATRSRTPMVLAVLITLGFFGVLVGMLASELKTTDSPALLVLLGSLGASWGAVVNYYFGSSADSGRKTELLAKAGPAG